MLSPQDFSDMVGMLREKYEFRRLPNNYILTRLFIPNDPAKIKTDLIYTYPITDKQLAITFLTEIKYRYKFRLSLPRSIMMVNPTDKPELPRKALRRMDRYDSNYHRPRYNNQAGPTPKLEELTFYVKDNIPDIAAQVSITDYDTTSQMIRTIQDHFNFTLIPNYLIDLPNFSIPE
ncbi:43951_t:CDS:2 [Gigaspora margarita]|uniref:43951_t:CDS:1 n=1 Tax=Gigaspora margarita TaxID=4874 RepID=A0ABN7VZL8_GIGMA|nr:43951_t:CDS:2 [Gigaspora margarita]